MPPPYIDFTSSILSPLSLQRLSSQPRALPSTMWLLSTNRAELHNFKDHEAVDGGYAILSHTWGQNEQTFQDIQDLCEQYQGTEENPRDHAPEKIQRSCLLAESYGFRWIWIDTCCIDKTSSTELSEAINSMFTWYSFSEVCFAYLDDVPSDCDLHASDSAFRTARWHTRGWTLQELIAPQVVIFISQDWVRLGDKAHLADLIKEITGVWANVLRHEFPCTKTSVATRMMWASRRRTTRVEDEAYCLMGLFNINMPTLYGEGRQAFQRLQHEIIKVTRDTSILAWGSYSQDGWSPVHSMDSSRIEPVYMQPFAHSPARFDHNPFYSPALSRPLQPYLPSQWQTSHMDQPEAVERREHGPFGQLELPTLTSTVDGLACRFPIIEVDGMTIAVLLCELLGSHLGLLLHPSPNPIQDPRRRMYRTAYTFQLGDDRVDSRLINLGNDYYNIWINGQRRTAQWRDICIEDSRAMAGTVAESLVQVNCIATVPPFRIPLWLIGRLTTIELQRVGVEVYSRPAAGANDTDTPMLIHLWCEKLTRPGEGIDFLLGTCIASSVAGSARTIPHWAKVVTRNQENWTFPMDALRHQCNQHHVEDWPNGTKTFGDADRTVILSFRSCKLNPNTTLVMHVELEGRVYTEMKRRNNVVIPSRQQLAREPNPASSKPQSIRSPSGISSRSTLKEQTTGSSGAPEELTKLTMRAHAQSRITRSEPPHFQQTSLEEFQGPPHISEKASARPRSTPTKESRSQHATIEEQGPPRPCDEKAPNYPPPYSSRPESQIPRWKHPRMLIAPATGPPRTFEDPSTREVRPQLSRTELQLPRWQLAALEEQATGPSRTYEQVSRRLHPSQVSPSVSSYIGDRVATFPSSLKGNGLETGIEWRW
ncbi:heterokaryon incompatibility protein-domain-containing protein [Earliella scabrosa]|nr:heterokaryon incompatibility protein-domain-containing protein [Earliella scabrosa]